jgi:hypothetical protein
MSSVALLRPFGARLAADRGGTNAPALRNGWPCLLGRQRGEPGGADLHDHGMISEADYERDKENVLSRPATGPAAAEDRSVRRRSRRSARAAAEVPRAGPGPQSRQAHVPEP